MAEAHTVDGALGLYSSAVVVTEKMITLTARAGDLKRLREWGHQGVCV
jgi:hypothetical protein